MESYFKATDLACYISAYHEKKTGYKISNIKLQKSLYFLFAYWGGFVKKGENLKNENDREGKEIQKLKKYLFADEIQAWTYGPVVPEVYHTFEMHYNFEKPEKTHHSIENIEKEPFVKSFIDDLLNDLFEVSDFKLVNISHQDNCWKSKYNDEDEYHNNEMDKEEIVNEYAAKI